MVINTEHNQTCVEPHGQGTGDHWTLDRLQKNIAPVVLLDGSLVCSYIILVRKKMQHCGGVLSTTV